MRFCGATYELTLVPSFRIGGHPTFSAAFLDISLSKAAILVTPGFALATLCRRVIQIGSFNESRVLPAASYQTSAFDGRSIPAVCDACINGVPPRALPRATQSQDPGRAGDHGFSFSTETSVALITANTMSPSLRFIRFTEPVVIIDVTIPGRGSDDDF